MTNSLYNLKNKKSCELKIRLSPRKDNKLMINLIIPLTRLQHYLEQVYIPEF
jgi:hypothetical protein